MLPVPPLSVLLPAISASGNIANATFDVTHQDGSAGAQGIRGSLTMQKLQMFFSEQGGVQEYLATFDPGAVRMNDRLQLLALDGFASLVDLPATRFKVAKISPEGGIVGFLNVTLEAFYGAVAGG